MVNINHNNNNNNNNNNKIKGVNAQKPHNYHHKISNVNQWFNSMFLIMLQTETSFTKLRA